MHTKDILEQAIERARNAKDGTVKINGKTYTFEFDQTAWNYRVYLDGVEFEFTNLNTKSLKQARAWLREYLAN